MLRALILVLPTILFVSIGSCGDDDTNGDHLDAGSDTGVGVDANDVSDGDVAPDAEIEPEATYFVDPQSGSDSNPGTQLEPWAHIPGNRDGSDSGFGPNPTVTLQAGDVIEIKAGAVFDSTHSNALHLTGTHYGNATPTEPIVIRVSSTWGTGNVVYDGAAMTVQTYWSLIEHRASNVLLRGAGASRRFEVRNSNVSSGYAISMYGAPGEHVANAGLEWINAHTSSYSVASIGYTTDCYVKNSAFHDANTDTGLQIGRASDLPNENLYLEDVDVYGNGLGSSGWEGLPHGIQIVGDQSVTGKRVRCYDNRRDGLDVGIVSGGGQKNSLVKMIDSDFYDNGEDGIGCNNQVGNTGEVRIQVFNSVLHNNGNGSQPYDFAFLELYHSVVSMNGRGIYANTYSTGSPYPTDTTIRNSILIANQPQVDLYGPNTAGAPGTMEPVFDTDGNLWVPVSSNAEDAWLDQYTGGTWFDYSSPIGYAANGQGLVGLSADPGFANLVDELDLCDFHVSAGGAADPNRAGGAVAVGVDTLPPEAATDREGNPRAAIPTVGLYESVAP